MAKTKDTNNPKHRVQTLQKKIVKAKKQANKLVPSYKKNALIDSLPNDPKKLKDNIAVWSEMKDLGVKYNCLSLGEGAPARDPPDFLAKAMNQAMIDGFNQNGRTFGEPILVNKIAEIFSKKLKHKIDPMNEVMVSQGANGALMSFISAFANKGDEVVVFCPMFPMYLDHCQMGGSKVIEVPLV